MGWNTVAWPDRPPLRRTASPTARGFYFVHSFAPDADGRTRSGADDARPDVRRRGRRGTTSSRRSSTRRSPGDAGLAAVRGFVQAVAGMIVIPAIDLRGGRAVRLLRGDPHAETVLRRRPGRGGRALPGGGRARGCTSSTSTPRSTQGDNREVVEAICHAVCCPCRWAAGCARSRTSRRCSSRRGARRSWARRRRPTRRSSRAPWRSSPSAIVVAVDVRGGHVMVKRMDGGGPGRSTTPSRRWTRRARRATSSPRSRATARWRAPTWRSTSSVLALTRPPVIASGGVRDADDIWALRDLGLRGRRRPARRSTRRR